MCSFYNLGEFIRSATAGRMNISNIPDFEEVENLKALRDVILDPIREKWGAPIIVTSGYRCPQLNSAVGGVRNSQHLTGQAADIVTKSRNPADIRRLFHVVLEMGLPFDQLINESKYSWLHISYRRDGQNRHNVLNL